MARLLTLIRIVLGSLMLAAVVINFSNVVGRYAFSKPIFWADEAMVFIQIGASCSAPHWSRMKMHT